jgi:glycine dehydrogenase subunit 2
MAKRLADAGFDLAYPTRRATHEFLITFSKLAKEQNVSAMDVAKRLLDFGRHSPTTYFPLLVPECWLVEPTETETKEELDAFVEALVAIQAEALEDPDKVRQAPWTLPVKRLDDVRAARQLDLVWKPDAPEAA